MTFIIELDEDIDIEEDAPQIAIALETVIGNYGIGCTVEFRA